MPTTPVGCLQAQERVLECSNPFSNLPLPISDPFPSLITLFTIFHCFRALPHVWMRFPLQSTISHRLNTFPNVQTHLRDPQPILKTPNSVLTTYPISLLSQPILCVLTCSKHLSTIYNHPDASLNVLTCFQSPQRIFEHFHSFSLIFTPPHLFSLILNPFHLFHTFHLHLQTTTHT